MSSDTSRQPSEEYIGLAALELKKRGKRPSAKGKVIKRCEIHVPGKKSCLNVIASGECLGPKCQLFKRVLAMLPKFKNLHEVQARGVIIKTIWDFSPAQEKKRLEKQLKSQKWLKEYYPRVKRELNKLGAG